jgi:hypothetical protein
MDTKQLIKDTKARFNHNASKQQLKEKYQAKLLVADQGGLWKASPLLLSQLNSSSAKTLIILDEYENPIQIDRNSLLTKLNSIYVSVMEEWHTEFKSLENNR